MAKKEEKAGKELLQRLYGGVQLSVEPYFTDFKVITSTGANQLWRGEPQPAIQAVIRAHPDNAGRVWVNVVSLPSSSKGWPLDVNDWIKLTVLDMHNLRALIVSSGDAIIVGRSS